jgi:hypothetical protein
LFFYANGNRDLPYIDLLSKASRCEMDFFCFLIFTFRNFIFFDPPLREGLRSPFFYELLSEDRKHDFSKIVTQLSKLPPGSLIYPEITRGRDFYSTPHFWSVFLRKYKLRNALGLTVESSLYPTLVFNWSFAGLPNSFKWGTELDWSQLFFNDIENSSFETQLPAFFQRSGIDYAVGHSTEFRNFIYTRSKSFKIIEETTSFILVEILKTENYSSLPAAFVSDKWLHSKSKIPPKNFLRESNLILANLHSHNIPLRIINIETDSFEFNQRIANMFSIIFLYITDDHLEEGYALAKSYTRWGVPVVLLKAPAPKNEPLIWDWNPIIYSRISKQLLKSKSESEVWKFTKTSYFPDLTEKNGNHLYQSDSNQIATFGTVDKLNLQLPHFKAQLLTFILFLHPITYLLLALTKKTR